MVFDQQPRKIPLVFYRSGSGSEPVREVPEVERHAIGKDLLRAQWRWPALGGGLWEVRTDLPTRPDSPSIVVPSRKTLLRGAAWVY